MKALNHDSDTVLEMRNITKIYSNGFVANNDITFSVRRGEIHGLMGENGAGKTTLMKVLFGLEKPEKGQIILNGQEVHIDNPLQALEYGIGMVHQHFMLVGSLTVAENMVLGLEPKNGLLFDYKRAVRETEEISRRFNLPIDANAIVNDISVGMKQRLEILKILYRGAKILLLDEPTAVLTPQETTELFKQLKHLRDQGYTIVFISHKLGEVKELCDRITVLRRGEVVGTADIDDVTELDISRMMVGKDVDLNIEKEEAKPGKTILRVRNLNYTNLFGKKALNNLSFDLRQGEILGVAGVEGNGQTELSEILSGLLVPDSGEVRIKGEPINNMSIRDIRLTNTSLIHEDRMIYGASADQTIVENIIADRYFQKGYNSKGFLNKKYNYDNTRELIKEYQIACDGPEARISTLSGGNIQKVVAAREFSSQPELLIVSQPTRGIDVGAAELIRQKMISLRDRHRTAILLFSADLTELLTMSDGIIVLYNGEIVAYFPDVKRINEEILGKYMLGLEKQSPEEIGGVVHEN
ncbi:MAG: ABC transporter ATP-binding protein [Halanaerobiales bacterium]